MIHEPIHIFLRRSQVIQFDELLTYLRREVKLARKDQNPKADDISRDGSVGGFFFLDRERKVHGPALATLIGTPFGGEEEETSILRPRNVVLAIIGAVVSWLLINAPDDPPPDPGTGALVGEVSLP